MNVAGLLAILCIAACGGATSVPTDRPAPGTSACEPSSDGQCILCSDDKWHCSGVPDGLATCPSAASGEGGNPCPADAGGCVACGSGTSKGIMCNAIVNPGGDNDVETTMQPVTCSQ